jgi:hypothetical protein
VYISENQIWTWSADGFFQNTMTQLIEHKDAKHKYQRAREQSVAVFMTRSNTLDQQPNNANDIYGHPERRACNSGHYGIEYGI